MLNRLHTIISILVILSFVLVLTSCAPSAAPTIPAQKATVTVNIGALLDLSGPTATSTQPGVDGIRDFINYENQKGGLDWSGGKVIIKLNEVDNRYDPSISMPAYDKMVAQGYPIILTHQSADNLALKGKAKNDQVVLVTLSPTPGALTPPGWVFANYIDHASAFCAFCNWAKATWKGSGTPKIASLTWDTAYGKAHMCALDYPKQIGLEYVGTEYTPMMPQDVSPQVTRLKEAGADYVWTQAVIISTYLKDMKRLGFQGKLVTGLNTGLIEWIPTVTPEVMAGTMHVSGLIDMAAADPNGPFMKKFNEVTTTLNVKRPHSTFYPNGASAAILVQKAIVSALNTVGDIKKLNGKACYDALVNMKNVDSLGITDKFTFSETQRRGSMSIQVVQAQPDGSIKLIADWTKAPDALEKYPDCAK